MLVRLVRLPTLPAGVHRSQTVVGVGWGVDSASGAARRAGRP